MEESSPTQAAPGAGSAPLDDAPAVSARRPPHPGRLLLARLLLLLLSLSAALLLLELLLRQVVVEVRPLVGELSYDLSLGEYRSYHWLPAGDPQGWRFIPGAHHGEITINRWGLRGDDYPRRPPPGESRVLLLGDSLAFGVQVPQEVSLAAHLERELGGRLPGSWRVLNGGVPGYNARQELLHLRRDLRGLGERLLLVQVTPNDLGVSPVIAFAGGKVRYRYLGDFEDLPLTLPLPWRAQTWLMSRSALYRYLSRTLARLQVAAGAPPPAQLQLTRSDNQAAWLQMAGEARRRHIPALFALFPELWPGGTPPRRERERRFILGFLRSQGLQVLDLLPAFPPEQVASLKLARPGDHVHPNGAGYRAAAALIASRLAQVLP